MSKYQLSIKLENNGRLFPNWVASNFKQYILPTVKIEGDPCAELDNKIEYDLTLYQEFIGSYLNYQSPFKDLLIMHGVGSGKTRTAINIYNILFNYTPKWNIFILIPASLRNEPWMKDINKYLTKKDYEKRFSNIVFVHYDSPYADTDFLEKVKAADASKKYIFIIDEVHRFIGNVYNNIYSKKGKRAQVIYDYIQQEKRENNETRILLLSATPVVNNPFEYILIFNLLRPDIFPTSESMFEQLFISTSNYTSLNTINKNMFQRRIMGLVSYYIGATVDKFASKVIKYVNVPMENYQEEIYNFFDEYEKKKEKMLRKRLNNTVSDKISTYLSYTRQACNFVFPINAEKRPRPSNIKLNELLKIDEGKNIDENLKNKTQIIEYNNLIKDYLNNFYSYINNIIKEDKDNNYTLNDDIIKIDHEFNNVITAYMKSTHNKSKLLLELFKLSPKFIRIIFNIKKTKGTVLVYSNYVVMEGLELFKYYLNLFNYISIDKDKEFDKNDLKKDGLTKDEYRFCEYHGSIDKDLRSLNKNIFNLSDNKYGKYCKIILISPAGSEGINLYNVRQVHIIEPYWNEVRIEQVIGRALRYCHHKDLPLEERIVNIYRYRMVRKNNKITTDEKLDEISRKKNNLLLLFTNAVKEVAIDCELFKEHNMMGSKYKCFNFTQDSLFEKVIGPAYKFNIDYDTKMNNGLNAVNSKVLRIKVRKIKAVYKISEDTYSEEKFYLYHDNSNIVYDIDLNYPIGKLDRDDNKNNILLDKDVYIIVDMINIPKNINYQ